MKHKIAGMPSLADELALLNDHDDNLNWLPPANSATATRSWSTYSAALHAAAEWFAARDRRWKFSERELAVRALGGSKKWSQPSKDAFTRVVGLPFDEAVYTADTGIRMLGPLSWKLSTLVADASVARPFVALPGKAASVEGTLEITAVGILLIENQETFQALTRTPVHEAWLCIWMEGYASDALGQFLRQMPDIPIVAWGDLDPPGIEIIINLAEKSDRDIQPIAMDAELYERGYMLEEDLDARLKWQTRARALATTAPAAFRGLAEAIAGNLGHRCEQEGLHELVMPTLADRLAHVLTTASAPVEDPRQF
ncbi:Wadjet anti-phage system protein JetD domain-containing protein [Nocardia salmonicida]|uniref:Wadjet anti-phage system protein JetD domain-containing protein n=1 Tax=Nocardia salmonicida TaxID=53431 RepID=UPI00366FDA26